MQEFMLFLVAWYSTGLLTCATLIYFDNSDIRLGDLLGAVLLSLLGPIFVLIVAVRFLAEHTNTIIWKRKK